MDYLVFCEVLGGILGESLWEVIFFEWVAMLKRWMREQSPLFNDSALC
jgi:hypothetical protein